MTLTTLAVAALALCGFVGAIFVASVLMPGRVHEARPDTGGARGYRLNGLTILVLTGAVVAASTAVGLWSPSVIPRHVLSLFVVANLFAVVVTLILTVRRRTTAGSALRSFLSGVELAPQWHGVDLKMFSYRPSLIGLALVNVSFAFAQYERYGFVSTPMWLYQVFTFLYVANYFHFEHGMLFTWDVLQERFGFGLVWGDYVLVPFFYSLPGWYLVDRVEAMPPLAVAGLVALYALGVWMFRGANEQKHRFKRDPHVRIWGAPAATMGGRLLVSGFWGIGRKLNYTGELLMYVAWTLPCGVGSVVPFLPALWLAVFFPHRAWRDDRRCREKYGALWVAYCERVPFRMIPFVF